MSYTTRYIIYLLGVRNRHIENNYVELKYTDQVENLWRVESSRIAV